MEVNIAPVQGNKARKRMKHENQWKRSVQKRERYSAKKPPNISSVTGCTHKKTNKLRCSSLHAQDIRKFHEAFYAKPDKTFQDTFILKFIKVHTPKIRKRKVKIRAESKTYTKFYIRTYTKPFKLVRVCQAAFAKALGVGIHRLRNISKKFLANGTIPQENRGGDRVSRKSAEKKENVMRFIESFKCIESHYCRSSTAERKYVSSELNIRKMWNMYNAQANEALQVRQSYFRHILNTKYNIGFKTPRVDVCSKCMELTDKIKNARTEEKPPLMATLRVHKLKAKCFYTFLREHNEETLSISFDCQKNQVLPKVPDQIAYYSRQLYIYNFTIVIGNSTNKFPKENVRIYAWTEDIHAKSSNEIASAVFDLLSKYDLTGKKKVRMLADGCGSQNKNSTMIAMVGYWLTNCAPRNVKSVELIFPVPGHSFMPADRVFGHIEKVIKNKEVIIDPVEYTEIYDRFGMVSKLGQDCLVKDWKAYASETILPPGKFHFKFAECKRYYVTRVKNKPGRFLLRGEVHYKSGSQNKNSTMIAMVGYWLTNCAPRNVKSVELIFPVPGHSFMPADRVFGHIEKVIKNKEVIIDPVEYTEIYDRFGMVSKLGQDCLVKDWKAYASETILPPGKFHFKFAECKRYYVTRVKNKPGRFLLRGEVHYKSDAGVSKSIIKRGVNSTAEFGIRDVPPFQTNVSALKLADVDKLLSKHYGENWKSELGSDKLRYYNNVLSKTYDDATTEVIEPCEYLEEVGISI